MSDKARKLIKQAIQSHLVDDGASEIGAYRDAVTEVLKFARKKFPDHSNEGLFHDVCDEGYDIYMEELELAGAFTMFTKDEVLKAIKKFEIQYLVGYLPTEHLPLLVGDPRWGKYRAVWGKESYDRLTTLFEKRMKGETDEVEEEVA